MAASLKQRAQRHNHVNVCQPACDCKGTRVILVSIATIRNNTARAFAMMSPSTKLKSIQISRIPAHSVNQIGTPFGKLFDNSFREKQKFFGSLIHMQFLMIKIMH
jgi:hypothetical protein